jgi:hypothetical protein
MFQTEVVENIKTLILCPVIFFIENRPVCERVWKNIVEPGMPYMTLLRMRIPRWIPKATNTHPECVMLIAFPLWQ